MLLVVASQSHELDNLLGSLVGERLPETGHHARNQRRGERSTVIIDDASPARNHRSRTTIRHHIRLDSSVSRRSYGTESRIHPHFVDASYGKNILCIGREINLLPTAHTVVSGRVDADDSLIGTHRSRTRDKGRISILLIIMMIHLRIIKTMITQGGIDNIHTAAVSIFRSLSPVILLGKTLRALVLATHQQILRIRSHTDINFRQIGSHRREDHRSMLHLSKDILGFRHHEITDACQMNAMKRRNLIHIHESTVKDSYHQALAPIGIGMEFLAIQGFQLILSRTVFAGSIARPVVISLSNRRTHTLGNGIGRLKDLPGLGDEIQSLQFPQFLLFVDADQQSIVPLALAHNLNARIAYGLEIGRSYGQVGHVDGKPLTLAALYGTGREKLLRTLYGIRRIHQILILEIETIHHALATRERHHISLRDARQPHHLLKICNPVIMSQQ